MGYGCSKLDGSGSHEGQAGELVLMRLDRELWVGSLSLVEFCREL